MLARVKGKRKRKRKKVKGSKDKKGIKDPKREWIHKKKEKTNFVKCKKYHRDSIGLVNDIDTICYINWPDFKIFKIWNQSQQNNHKTGNYEKSIERTKTRIHLSTFTYLHI